MPFQFRCSRCGTLLFEADDILYQSTRKRGKTDYSDSPPITQFITHKIGGSCPKCGRRLAETAVDVEVHPLRSVGMR